MKTFNDMAAQGDLMIRRVNKLPEGLKKISPNEKGVHVVAHSETGHHHTIPARTATLLETGNDPMTMYLCVDEVGTDGQVNPGIDLIHHRSFDTHETLRIAPGNYQIRRQREYTPEGWRRIED